MYASRSLRACPLVVFAAGLLACACARESTKGAATSTSPVDTVRFAVTSYLGTCPVMMARAQGYFASEGVAADVRFEPSGKAALQAALHGDADLATAADVPIMFAVSNGQPVSVIATISSAREDHAVVGRTDKGVVTPSSLRGKRIGVPLGTSAHFFLDAFLNRQSIAFGDVTLIDTRPDELAGALRRGDVDAIAIWQPYANSAAASLGVNAVSFRGETVYDDVYALVGGKAYVDAHARAVEKVLRATMSGAHYCNDNTESASAQMAKLTHVDEASLKQLWPAYRFDVALRQGLILALEDESRWAIRNRLTPARELPNFLSALALEPMQSVAPTAVTVIH